MTVTFVEEEFDLYTDKTTGKTIPVRLFRWENANKISVDVITYGATVTSIKVPDKNGVLEDIVMGFNDLSGYQKAENPYFGATVGRVANRIGFGQIKFNDTIIDVNKNYNGKHQLHGGFVGFDKSLFKKPHKMGGSVELQESDFDTFTTNEKTYYVKKFTWSNKNRFSVEVITYGATITSIKFPDKNGTVADIVTGFDDIDGYRNPLNRYFGATIGRVANRINRAKINFNNSIYTLSSNHNTVHHLHGGFLGFDKVIWQHYVDGTKLILSYHSADLEEGYPGDLVVHTIFELTENNEFLVEFKATTTKPTFVNLTNHSYFNLAGHGKGAEELYKHTVCINSDAITEVDADSIPTGTLLPVAFTTFDLQIPKVLGDVINKVPNSPGFDHNFCITKGPEQGQTFVARVHHPESGRVLEVYSNQPGVQFYTSNFLPENPSTFKGDKKDLKSVVGKGAHYYKHGALCLETQNWPDAPNHKNFPKAVLYPGETYYHSVLYKFSIKN